MGQVFVAQIPTSTFEELIHALQRDGFETESALHRREGHQNLHCKQLGDDIVIETYPDPKQAGQTIAVVAYPPYSWRPWCWPREHRLFDSLTSHLDRLQEAS